MKQEINEVIYEIGTIEELTDEEQLSAFLSWADYNNFDIEELI